MNFESHMDELGPADAAAFRAVARRLRAAPQREPSASLTARIMAAADAERALRRRRWWRGAPGLGVAAAAACAALLLTVRPLRPAGSPASRGEPQDAGAARAAWLAACQEADGAWSPARHGGSEEYRPALTALAALALHAAGGPEREEPVRRAGGALAALQRDDGSFGGQGRALYYNQALVTLALASLAPRQPGLKPALERALAFIARRQSAEGGWDYEAGSGGNAAVTAWQVRALASAEGQGFGAARVPLRKGLRWLRGQTRDDGHIAYHRESAACSEGVTALAAHALMTAGRDFPGLPELGRQTTATLSVGGAQGADCYRDYAKVLALDSSGAPGQAEAVRRLLLERQAGGAQDQWGAVGGTLYTAAFTALAACQTGGRW